MNNPYQPDSPIGNPALFFGRTALLLEMMHLLQTNQSVSLVGPPHMGRTSVLRQLVHQNRSQNQPESHFIYLDCATLAQATPPEILRRFAQAIGEVISQNKGGMETALMSVAEAPSFLAFDTAIRRLDRQGLQITLLLDDFEWLSDNPQLEVGFLNALRSTSARYHFGFCITSTRQLIHLSYLGRQVEMMTSPFFNIFSNLTLEPLSPEAANQLVTEPAAQSGLTIPAEIIAYIIEHAAGHPQRLQMLAYHAFALVQQGRTEQWAAVLSAV